MMVQISSNGLRLTGPGSSTLTTRRRYRLTLSLYGATEASYDGMTRRKGSFRRFMLGLAAAHEAGLAMRINIVVSNRNAHEVPAMRTIADRFGIEAFEYTNISPTIHGGGEVLPSQSREMLRTRKPYAGCNAGITHFHADPHGKASICKVGRDPQIDLIAEGAYGLRRLAAAADALLTRHGGCTGCTLQKTCGTCMPLASLYRQAEAPLEVFCQHGGVRRSPVPGKEATPMSAVAVVLSPARPRRPGRPKQARYRHLRRILEVVADTDTLLTMCACSATANTY